MKQKFAVTVADVPMNIVCDETQETIDAAVSELDRQLRTLTSAPGHSCTRTEAALLLALDYSTRCMHLRERVAELERYVDSTDPTGDTYEANLLRGENETLRAQLQVSRGTYDALLQDNATLFQLNAKLVRQNGEANARADRMHDQVLSILTEVRELRERLAAMCVETRAPSAAYSTREPEPAIEITPHEQQVTRKYEQMSIDDILLDSARGGARSTAPVTASREQVENESRSGMLDMLDYEDGKRY
ncbi:MAG: cell division protein ZapA [Ruminococcaceae bacterium]|nr:cell division protein ZapA [Oscillospiraceae bacterium]